MNRKLLEAFSRMFDFSRNRTGKAIVTFFYSAAMFAVFTNALYGLMSGIARLLLYRIGLLTIDKPGEMLAGMGADFALPLLLFAIAVWLMARNYRRTSVEHSFTFEPPKPCQALIVMLSCYSDRRGESRFKDVATVKAAIEQEDFRAELLKSNWGPLLVAVQHHAATLKHCWVICTEDGKGPNDKGSAGEFGVAESIIKKFTGQTVTCHPVPVKEYDQIECMVEVVNEVYRKATLEANVEVDEIMADITGATATMSGGMILATVLEERKIEYLRQSVRLHDENGAALLPEALRQQSTLVSLRTSPVLVTKPL